MDMEYFNRRDSAAVGALKELAPTNDLKKALECPICNEVPLAPIYTCSSGHTICGRCRNEMRCGICNEDMRNTSRNATVEMIVASSSFWCKYLADGCPAVVKGSEYRDHAASCEFRRLNCFEREVKPCPGTLIRLKDYFRHLKMDHEIEGFKMSSNVLPMSEYSNCLTTDGPWPTYYLEYDDEVFLRKMTIEKSIIYLWFTLIGSKEDASKYRVKVSVYMKKDESSRCDWTVPVYSERKSPSELEKCFRVAIPAKQMETYCSQRQHPHGQTFKYVFDLQYEIISLY